MNLTPASSPSLAFKSLSAVHLTFIGAIFIYFAVGEIMYASMDDFPEKGLVDAESGMIWLVRGMLIFLALTHIILVQTMFGDEAMVNRTLPQQREVTTSVVVQALLTAAILRLAMIEAVAIYGLVLFELDAQRYDLYGFGVVALISLVLLRPSRASWEESLRRVAIEHPGVETSFS